MNDYFISANDFDAFVSKMVSERKVVGPKAKQTKFVFGDINSSEELRLDYDVTILPPKKVFTPPCQTLVTFDGTKFDGAVDNEPVVLFGVHFYDIKGLDMTDQLFSENNKDINYTAKREASTIIGSNIQNVSTRAFWGTIGTETEPQGHDGFVTKIGSGYHYQSCNQKGEDLIAFGNFQAATLEQVEEARNANEEMMTKCPEKLSHSSEAIQKKVRASFNNEKLWTQLAEDCFSCGSCNTTCPTCYCFDVQDKWNLNQVSGMRNRYWDSCLTEDFAKCSLGGGLEENFREKRGERFRHRFMRKAAYLNEKLGGPACTGCGRCSSSCTADIADPVTVINKIMEV